MPAAKLHTGILREIPTLLLNGWSAKELAARYDIGYRTIYTWIHQAVDSSSDEVTRFVGFSQFTLKEEKLIADLYHYLGWSQREIAKAFGVIRGPVERLLGRLGVKKSERPRREIEELLAHRGAGWTRRQLRDKYRMRWSTVYAILDTDAAALDLEPAWILGKHVLWRNNE